MLNDEDISDEDLLTPLNITKIPADSYIYNISHIESISHLDSLISTYKQFSKFPPNHPSYPALRRKAAIYEYIKKCISQLPQTIQT